MPENKKVSKGDLFDTMFEQAINEWVRPGVDKIPDSFYRLMNGLKIDKVLPFIGMALTTLAKNYMPHGERFGDFFSETSAELRRRAREVAGGETKSDDKNIGGKQEKIFRLILNPELVNDLDNLSQYLEIMLKDKKPEEKEDIFSLLARMEPAEFYVFLKMDETVRTRIMNTLLKKEKKDTAKSIEELKKSIAEAKEATSLFYKEILGSPLNKLDDLFAPGREASALAFGLEKESKKMLDSARKRLEEKRSKRKNR